MKTAAEPLAACCVGQSMGSIENLGLVFVLSMGTAGGLCACGGIIADSDGGTDPGGGTDAGAEASEYESPTVCTSGEAGPTTPGSSMRPGAACNACHVDGGHVPAIPFIGTVYPTAHEPDLCVGASPLHYPGVQVVITDAHGQTTTLTPNSAGNFLGPLGGTVPLMPYQAKVTYQGRERVMVSPETNGDCNACHTETGTNGAPGRVMLP